MNAKLAAPNAQTPTEPVVFRNPPIQAPAPQLSHGWDYCSVPLMGQASMRMKAVGLEQARRPEGTHFGIGHDVEAAQQALGAARAHEATASIAAQLVMDQAVAGLQDAGLTVRQIADALGTSKSDVGRRLRDTVPAVLDYPEDLVARITATVRRAWEEGL
jgi:hypothetical protein